MARNIILQNLPFFTKSPLNPESSVWECAKVNQIWSTLQPHRNPLQESSVAAANELVLSRQKERGLN
jgi:hypothetical protein